MRWRSDRLCERGCLSRFLGLWGAVLVMVAWGSPTLAGPSGAPLGDAKPEARVGAEGPARQESPRAAPDPRGGAGDQERKDGTAGTEEEDTTGAAPWRRGVSPEHRTKALALFKQGNRFHENLQYSQALALYRQALQYWKHPAIQFNITDCYINMDLPLEAYRAVTAALRFGQGPLTAIQHRQAQNYRKLLRARLAEITVVVEQPGALVALDGRPLLTGPGSRSTLVLPGDHLVVGTRPGFVTLTRKLSAASSGSHRLRMQLVSVDSLLRNRKVVYVRRWKPWMPWAVFSAGALVATVGLSLLAKARSELKSYDAYVDTYCSEGCHREDIPDPVWEKKESSRAYSGAAIGLASLGAALATSGVVLLILNRPKESAGAEPSTEPHQPSLPRVLLAPHLGPDGVSLSAEVRF